MDFKNTTITILLILLSLIVSPGGKAEGTYQPISRSAGEIVQNDFSDYMQNIQDKLQKVWQPPDFMEEGHVKVYFKLNRQGQVMGASIIESSGDDIYDESALEALKNCSPFGEFPENTLKEFIAIKYSFDTILIEEERMHGFYELAKANAKNNPRMALEYLDMAIDKVGGEEASYFLYKKRAEIKETLGDEKGAKKDYDTYDTYVKHSNIKRIHLLKHLVKTHPTPYKYHYLAYAYEQIGEYDNAIGAIDKAIALTDENGTLKRYRNTLIQKQWSK